MRCHICDNNIDNPQTNFRTGKIEPCTTCLEAIKEIRYDGVNDTIEGIYNTIPDDEADVETSDGFVQGALSELG